MKSGSFLDGDMGKRILTPTPPKCVIFMFKIQKFFSGEGNTPPRTPPRRRLRRLDSRAFGARRDPQKNPGYGPGYIGSN
jgi:hypothetical protein